MKHHILIISQYFYPETFRINDMAQEWVKRGYKVTVLTGIPNYPVGKFFLGYSWRKKRYETWKGINIVRIPLIPRGKSSIGMIMNYLSFVISGIIWNLVCNVKADIVFSYEVSPMTQVKVGCAYAKKHRVPHFVYVQDLWPENVETVTGIKSRFIIGPIDRMVDKIYKQVDHIFVTSPSFVNAVINRRAKVPPTKVHYWPQYAEEFYRPLTPNMTTEIDDLDDLGDCYKIAFTGNIGTAQGLDILPKAICLLKDTHIKVIIVGDGRYKTKFEKIIDNLGVKDKFIMIPRVPAERIPIILSVCDAGFISFKKTPLWEKTIPAKLQSYMACGKSIIASASGETKRIIKEANCGVCCKIGDSKALAAGIKKIMSLDNKELGTNSRKYFEKNFEKKMLMDEMEVFFNKNIIKHKSEIFS